MNLQNVVKFVDILCSSESDKNLLNFTGNTFTKRIHACSMS